MDKKQKVKCYYKQKYNKYNKLVIVNVIITRDKSVILNEKCKFNSNSIRESSEKSIQYIINYLQELYRENKIDKNENVEILVKNKDIIHAIYGLKEKDKNITLEKIRNILEDNKNIKIKHFKYSNSIINNFLNKHIKNQKKRKLKETKKLSDVINIYENVVFFDLEMNYGLKGGKNINETISIGAIKYNRNFNYQEKERFYSFIKPIYNVKLNEKIIELTKIKQEEIDNAKDFNSVMNDFYNWVGHERTIFVSWGLADLRILNSDNENNGEDLEIVHTIKENYVDFQEEFCEFMKSKNSISLLNGLKEYNIKFNGIQHNPLDDAVNLKELAIKFIDAHKKVKV